MSRLLDALERTRHPATRVLLATNTGGRAEVRVRNRDGSLSVFELSDITHSSYGRTGDQPDITFTGRARGARVRRPTSGGERLRRARRRQALL